MRGRTVAGPAGPALLVAIAALAGSAAGEAASPESRLRGTVRDDEGEPLAEVQVKAFVDGFLRATAVSTGDGGYELTVPAGGGPDVTVAIWWLPNEAGQVPEVVLLAESSRARDLKIWGPCIPRLEAASDGVHDVVLHREAEKFRLLAEAECMKSAPLGP